MANLTAAGNGGYEKEVSTSMSNRVLAAGDTVLLLPIKDTQIVCLKKHWDENFVGRGFDPDTKLALASNGNVVFSIGKRRVTLAKVLLDVGEGLRIKFLTKNKLDLRPSNVKIVRGLGGPLPEPPPPKADDDDRMHPDFIKSGAPGDSPQTREQVELYWILREKHSIEKTKEFRFLPGRNPQERRLEGFDIVNQANGTAAPQYNMRPKYQKAQFSAECKKYGVIKRWGRY